MTGLRVADVSVMPEILTGNTNAAAMMIGSKAAAMIAEDNVNEWRLCLIEEKLKGMLNFLSWAPTRPETRFVVVCTLP